MLKVSLCGLDTENHDLTTMGADIARLAQELPASEQQALKDYLQSRLKSRKDGG
jgi:hypothetical protein